VSVPGVAFQLLDGSQAAAHEEELTALHAEVCESADREGGFARRFGVWRRQPGFALATAWHGAYLVGYACGMPLRPATSWWRELTTPLPADVTAEHPGRTFALTALSVRAPWRRQGIGWSLYDLVMSERTEERATLTLAPGNTAAQRAFRSWGWQKIARTRGQAPAAPALDVLVNTLRK
jgi:ribosomal protein S18 acetylase RimI-like enzyme